MQVDYAQLKVRSPAVTAAIADARSARNLLTRRERETKTDEIEAARARRRRRQKVKEELLTRVSRRVRVDIPEKQRPKIGGRAARKLFQRASGLLPGLVGFSNARGADGFYSIHFDFTPRGFASTKGRSWRTGEAERAARYITREEGLEGGEHGWWSNIAEGRTELVGFFRTLEALEQHDRSNANVYISEIIALPAELSARQRRKAVRRICRFFERRGLGYVTAMHLPNKAGDQRNFHCHILYSLRPCERQGPYDWSFAVGKEGDINTSTGIAARRQTIVRDINATLRAAAVDKRYTPLSNRARGMDSAEPNVGQIGTWLARRIAAMEAREALLRKVRSIAAHVRSALVDGSARLARLGAAIDHRHAEAARRTAEVRVACGRVQAGAAHLAAARQGVEQRLGERRSRLVLGSARERTAIAGYAPQVARTLEAHRLAIGQASSSAAERLRRASRYAALRSVLDMLNAAQTDCAARGHTAAAVLRDRLQSFSHAARLRKTGPVPDLARIGNRMMDTLLELRRRLSASLAGADQRLGRAGERMNAIEALLTKRQALDTADAERQQRSLLHIPGRRRIVVARIEAMRPAMEALDQQTTELAALRTDLAARLSSLRGSVAARIEIADQRLCAAREQGRRRITSGIGKGPQQGDVVATTARQSPAPQAASGGPAPCQPAPAVSPAAAAAARRPRGETQERLRKFVRARKPDKAVWMFPPPGEQSPAPANTLLLAAERMAMLRAGVRRREKQVREALRKQALDRLKRLDIPVGVNREGQYEVAKGGLLDEEMRALMDPVLREETQAFLGVIAHQQHDRMMMARIAPTPQALPAQPGLDPLTLAAAASNRKSKGVRDW